MTGKWFRSLCIVTLGLLITTIAYKVFLNDHSVSVGGVTGICVIAEAHLNIPYTVSLVALNLGLFLWGLREKGMKYVARSCAAMIALGVLLDIPIQIPESLQIHSRLSAMIVGSVLSGIGYALVVSQDTSTGGSDLLGMIINKKYPSFSTGLVMTVLDFLVILMGSFVDGLDTLPFSASAVVLCNGTLDLVVFLVSGMTPAWMHRVKRAYLHVRKRVLGKRVTFNPYALASVCIIIFIIFHELLMLGGVHMIPA